jgi:hypothetical protein
MATTIDELLARMPEIAKAVNAFESPAVQELAFAALLDSAGVVQSPPQKDAAHDPAKVEDPPKKRAARQSAAAPVGESDGSQPKRKGNSKKQSFTLLKDLDLYSSNPKLADFAADKAPSTVVEKAVLLVYWFVHHGNVSPVTIDMVYTGFKDRNWPVPSDLANTLQQAGTRGLLDSRDRQNLLLTTKGENLLDHDLPRMKG